MDALDRLTGIDLFPNTAHVDGRLLTSMIDE
jgi:hypothetical protein